ncbi:EAL domain-containing protein [Phreatobacter sp.]|uniref:putative bifunctional diguanylate cyclase/phosphodiesterase n=1 Tax=Phreatobacter sp. TaxID=1966341 RepID=UPI0025DF03B7|nr:EAL domain-containing protein [Phreatobacter sp.]
MTPASSLTHIRDAWEGWRKDVPNEPAHEGQIRAAQIHAVARFSPLTMAANLINAVVVVFLAREEANPLVLAAWALTILAVVALTTRAWFLRRGRKPRLHVSARAIRRATYHAAALAALWAAVPVLWFGIVSPEDQLVIACLVTGMICAGGFALATIPPAAYAYVAILSVGSVIGLIETGNSYVVFLTLLLLAYSWIVVQSVANSSRLFSERFRAEASLKERGEIIELLLNEFEQNGSDWLFDTDAGFAVVQHSARFGEVAGVAGQSLVGRRIVDMADEETGRALRLAIAKRQPFRDLDIQVEIAGEPRWWSLTAKPLADESGWHVGWRGVGSDITDRKLASQKVVWMARTDMLTGLPNRTRFRELAALRLETARRNGNSFALACLDLDQFKAVNDTLGHPVGDALLMAVSRDLGDLAEPGVVFGRFGGDEFGMVISDFARRSDVLELAQRIIARISRSRTIDGARITVGASVGIAFGSGENDTVDDLIRNADLALYRAKDNGRGVVMVFDDTMHREAEERRLLQEDLRAALDGNQLRLAYQPIIDIRAGAIVGFEALLRWRHPQRGLLSPDAFIPIAEESGLIEPIGAWVLRRACLDAAAWPNPIRVAVNISPAQFGSAALLNHVAQALAVSHLPADRLEVEITEALFMNQMAESGRFLTDMRTLGIRIALDDFGTGFSSLGYLTRFPIQKLKIDRSFVSGAADPENRKAVVEAIVGIAASLGFVTTAEGVETAADLAWVRDLGCDQAQGFYFARTLSAEAVPGFIAGFADAFGGIVRDQAAA